VPTKVLVVEDDPEIAQLTAAYLTSASYQVLTALDGQDGLELFYREQPDLVLLDLMLPELHGMDIARIIRQESDTPIIMLTAVADDVDRIAGLEAGADDYIVKPFNPRELLARVRTVLRRSSAARQSVVTVFVSSVMRDYSTKREAVRGAVQDLADAGFPVRAVIAEILPAAADSPRNATLGKVVASDIYVGILGERYGSVNTNTGLAATHEEYRQARQQGKPILVFLERLADGVQPEEEQRAFIKEVQDYVSGHYLKWFANEAELRYEAYRAVERLLQRRS
jgi:CheY-like chemotaxis protein